MVALTRRRVLSSLAASLGAMAAAASQLTGSGGTASAADEMAGMDHGPAATPSGHSGHAGFALGGAVDSAANGFDPSRDRARLRLGRDVAARGRAHAARVGARRARQGDRDRPRRQVRRPGRTTAASPARRCAAPRATGCASASRNGRAHPHTIHFHGIHPAAMDGVPGLGEEIGGGLIEPGEAFTYEFDAEPFGLHLYHCHAAPLAAHIAKGLYGAFIIDPKERRAPRPTSS